MFGPIFRWEAVRSVRDWKHFRQRSLLALTLAAGVAYAWFVAFGTTSASTGDMSRFGAHAAWMLTLIQTAAMYLFAPLLLAGSLAEERAAGRLLLLRTTFVGDREIVWDKFGSALAACGLYGLTGLPLFLAVSLFGGVDPARLLQAVGALAVNAVVACAASTYGAARAESRAAAAMNSYVLLAAWVVLLPLAGDLFMTHILGSQTPHQSLAAFSPTWATLYPWRVYTSAMGSFGWALVAPLLPCLSMLWLAARAISAEPRARVVHRAVRERSGVSHLDPIGWRANVLNAYDRQGRIRRMHAVALIALLLLAVAGVFRPEFHGLAATAAVLYAYTVSVVLPALLLIADRERGWQRELYGTPFEVKYIHEATVDAIWKKVEPACMLPVSVEIASLTALFVAGIFWGNSFAGAWVISLLPRAVLYFLAYWPIRAAFWQSVREGVAQKSLPSAVGAALRRSFATIVIGQLLLALLIFASFALLALLFFWGGALFFPFALIWIAWGYIAYFNGAVRLAKSSTDAMLGALDRSRTFGEAGGQEALRIREMEATSSLQSRLDSASRKMRNEPTTAKPLAD